MNPLRLFWGWKPRKIECFRATNQSVKQLPILEKRKIQAEVLGPVFREMVEQVGSEKAASILKEAIRKAAIEEGKHFYRVYMEINETIKIIGTSKTKPQLVRYVSELY